jgi:uncharacterized protein YyaL (SSP411 family)
MNPKLGGFGGPPKFPRPSEINLLLRAAPEQADYSCNFCVQRFEKDPNKAGGLGVDSLYA